MSDHTFYLESMLGRTRGIAHDARLKHPFLLDPVIGSEAIRDIVRETHVALDQEVVAALELRGERMAATVWRSGALHGVTVVITNADDQITEVRILLREFVLLAGWRARLRDRLPTALGWELTGERKHLLAAEHADPEPADTSAPVPLASDVRFHGPAFVKPIQGAESVRQVIGHARAAYGSCEYGPPLRGGSSVLRAYTSRLPLEIASLLQLGADGSAQELSVFMQPWPTVAVFCDRLRARLAGALDPSYFELDRHASSRPSSEHTP